LCRLSAAFFSCRYLLKYLSSRVATGPSLRVRCSDTSFFFWTSISPPALLLVGWHSSPFIVISFELSFSTNFTFHRTSLFSWRSGPLRTFSIVYPFGVLVPFYLVISTSLPFQNVLQPPLKRGLTMSYAAATFSLSFYFFGQSPSLLAVGSPKDFFPDLVVFGFSFLVLSDAACLITMIVRTASGQLIQQSHFPSPRSQRS